MLKRHDFGFIKYKRLCDYTLYIQKSSNSNKMMLLLLFRMVRKKFCILMVYPTAILSHK